MNPNAAEALVRWRESGTPITRKTPFEKLREKPTLKRAITAKCCDCMGWEEGKPMPSGLKNDVKECTSESCPLYEFRPWQKVGASESQEESSDD
jgi:hypothetical protein